MDNNKNVITIAIDGYSSSGKSSMAKSLAKKIGYRYIDSGAMYRAVTLFAMKHNMISSDHIVNSEELVAALPQIKIDFKVCENGQHTMLNGEDVEQEIRQLDVSNNVSQVAAIPAIRHALVAMQQAFGTEKGIVMDGRDIGTTVFPNAELGRGSYVRHALVIAIEIKNCTFRIGQCLAHSKIVSANDVFSMANDRPFP